MTSKAVLDVIAELARQRAPNPVGEGFDEAHDAKHDHGDLVTAGACYALNAASMLSPYDGIGIQDIEDFFVHWPWEKSWWKPKDPRRDMVRAAALILAEIERLDRGNG